MSSPSSLATELTTKRLDHILTHSQLISLSLPTASDRMAHRHTHCTSWETHIQHDPPPNPTDIEERLFADEIPLSHERDPPHPTVDPNWMADFSQTTTIAEQDRWFEERRAEMAGERMIDTRIVRELYPDFYHPTLSYAFVPANQVDPAKVIQESDLQKPGMKEQWEEMIARALCTVMAFPNLDEPNEGEERPVRQAATTRGLMAELPHVGGHEIEPRRKSRKVRKAARDAERQRAADVRKAAAALLQAQRTEGGPPVGRQSVMVPINENPAPTMNDRLASWLDTQAYEHLEVESETDSETSEEQRARYEEYERIRKKDIKQDRKKKRIIKKRLERRRIEWSEDEE